MNVLVGSSAVNRSFLIKSSSTNLLASIKDVPKAMTLLAVERKLGKSNVVVVANSTARNKEKDEKEMENSLNGGVGGGSEMGHADTAEVTETSETTINSVVANCTVYDLIYTNVHCNSHSANNSGCWNSSAGRSSFCANISKSLSSAPLTSTSSPEELLTSPAAIEIKVNNSVGSVADVNGVISDSSVVPVVSNVDNNRHYSLNDASVANDLAHTPRVVVANITTSTLTSRQKNVSLAHQESNSKDTSKSKNFTLGTGVLRYSSVGGVQKDHNEQYAQLSPSILTKSGSETISTATSQSTPNVPIEENGSNDASPMTATALANDHADDTNHNRAYGKSIYEVVSNSTSSSVGWKYSNQSNGANVSTKSTDSGLNKTREVEMSLCDSWTDISPNDVRCDPNRTVHKDNNENIHNQVLVTNRNDDANTLQTEISMDTPNVDPDRRAVFDSSNDDTVMTVTLGTSLSRETVLSSTRPIAAASQHSSNEPANEYSAIVSQSEPIKESEGVVVHFCSPHTDSHNISWALTDSGVLAFQPCPSPYVGTVYRPCSQDGIWGNTDLMMCRISELKLLKRLVSEKSTWHNYTN